jgi:hypothetical protein
MMPAPARQVALPAKPALATRSLRLVARQLELLGRRWPRAVSLHLMRVPLAKLAYRPLAELPAAELPAAQAPAEAEQAEPQAL